MRWLAAYMVVSFFSLGALAESSYLKDYEKKRKDFGIEKSPVVLGGAANRRMVNRKQDAKIAVIDADFSDIDFNDPTEFLPPGGVTTIIRNWETLSPDFPKHIADRRRGKKKRKSHGRLISQVFWAMTGFDASGPEMHLLRAETLEELASAVRYCKEKGIQLILNSQNWECCGVDDGKTGEVDKIVNEATEAGIFWVQAAGNDRGRVFVTGIDSKTNIQKDGAVFLTDNSDQLAIKAKEPVEVKISLTWTGYVGNDNKPNKMLDLYVVTEREDGTSAEVSAQQVGVFGKAVSAKTITLKLPANTEKGKHYLRVVHRYGTFKNNGGKGGDIIKLAVIPTNPFVQPPRLDRASKFFVTFNPANNAGVMTIGDWSNISSVGPNLAGLWKPDVRVADSTVRIKNDEYEENAEYGSSMAAAIAAGVVFVKMIENPDWTREDHIKYLNSQSGAKDPERRRTVRNDQQRRDPRRAAVQQRGPVLQQGGLIQGGGVIVGPAPIDFVNQFMFATDPYRCAPPLACPPLGPGFGHGPAPVPYRQGGFPPYQGPVPYGRR